MSLAQTANAGLGVVRARYEARGQGHVFRFWESLDAAARARLLAQAGGLDLDALARHRARARRLATDPAGLEPAAVRALPEHGGDARWHERAREAGEASLAAGQVAVVVLAGGQGTRLGHPGPKGSYPLGPVTGRTLFGLQAQKLRRLARRYGRPLPWYVMTSAATDDATRRLFAAHDGFGVDPGSRMIFRQAEMPVLDLEGRLLLEAPDRIATAPDGHGGLLPALVRERVLEDAAARGVRTLFSYQVDNPLARLADPVLIGAHDLAAAEMTSKAVRKRAPDERVGTLARVAGRVRVIEYTEIREPARSAREPDGALRFWAGSIGIHALDVAFAARVGAAADAALPYHLSPKRVPCADASGRTRTPAEPNAVKLERFVFDALPEARSVELVEARREEEYSPVKNPEGSESPATARRDLVACVRRWLEAAGVEAPANAALEVDHARIDGADDLRALGIQRASQAPDAIFIGTGGNG